MINAGIIAQKYIPDFFTEKFTKGVCSIMGRTKRRSAKLQFAKTYKIDWAKARECKDAKSLEECVDKFDTLNDIFARKIDPSLTKPEKTGPKDIVSPAQCYARKVDATEVFSIKGAYYTLKTLLARTNVPQKSEIFIFRLAPEQYHRFHSPTNSTVTKITEQGGSYKSVNPILLNTIPVLQQNYRKIIDFENGLIMVTVGATCVGSVKLSIKKGDEVKHGDDIGYFEFGGSCIALIVPTKLKKVNKRLSANETIIQPGTFIAQTK